MWTARSHTVRTSTPVREQRAAELAREAYTAGLTDFQNVLDAERSMLDLEDSLAESRGRVVENLVGLYKALGGGWQGADD